MLQNDSFWRSVPSGWLRRLCMRKANRDKRTLHHRLLLHLLLFRGYLGQGRSLVSPHQTRRREILNFRSSERKLVSSTLTLKRRTLTSRRRAWTRIPGGSLLS